MVQRRDQLDHSRVGLGPARRHRGPQPAEPGRVRVAVYHLAAGGVVALSSSDGSRLWSRVLDPAEPKPVAISGDPAIASGGSASPRCRSPTAVCSGPTPTRSTAGPPSSGLGWFARYWARTTFSGPPRSPSSTVTSSGRPRGHPNRRLPRDLSLRPQCGRRATLDFTGVGVRIWCSPAPNFGRPAVYLDGEYADTLRSTSAPASAPG